MPDQVWFRIDFPRWLSRLSARDRRMAEALAAGSRPGEVAAAFGASAGRISQKRREFYDSWRAFHGEGRPPDYLNARLDPASSSPPGANQSHAE